MTFVPLEKQLDAPEAIDYSEPPLRGQTAIVFGAGVCGDGWGNGEATAVAFARAGANVVCVDLHLSRADSTAELVDRLGRKAISISCDVSDGAGVNRVISKTLSEFGRVDVVHNNVGMSPFGDPVSMDEETWDRTFDVNVKSVFLACKYALPIMRNQRHGSIINISSILSTRISEYDLSSYYASKAAVDHLTRALAVSNGPYGIRANVIQPGLINTPQIHAHGEIVDLHGDLEATVASRDAMSPTLKQGSAWDIANAAVFLASDAAKYINGQVIAVDGGLTAKQAAQRHPAPEGFRPG